MLRYRITKNKEGRDVYQIDSEGIELLHNPILNKGSAFSPDERRLFGIDGYLPAAVSTMKTQVARRYEGFQSKTSDLEKYIYLRALQDRNETLFYALLMEHLDEMIPIVYTPTVGLACQLFSHIFRFTRGLFFTPDNIGRIDAILQSLPYRSIEMIVVTDSEGILGIGDQGVGGMGIPVGKLSLYVAGAGIHPANCLPITLDVGTDNEDLLSDPLYLGVRQNRLRGEAYLTFIDKFVSGIRKHFPGAILQWEDFSKQNAFTLLDQYRKVTPSFNDDIQGTGAVTLAGVNGAMRIMGRTLSEQVFAILGAGAGGIGVARQIHAGLVGDGLSPEEARHRIYVLDSRGVVYEGRAGVDAYKKEFARGPDFARGWDLADPGTVSMMDLVKNAGVSVLLGLSGVPDSFPEDLVREMAARVERPVIFPLSNPTSNAEARPKDIYRWTEGRAIVAAGSPFDNVNQDGKVFVVGQGNNVFIFPGVGLGALLVEATEINEEMFTVAARRLSELVSAERLELMCVYPAISDLRTVCREIAVAVAKNIMDQGLAGKPGEPENLERLVDDRMWVPRYAEYKKG